MSWLVTHPPPPPPAFPTAIRLAAAGSLSALYGGAELVVVSAYLARQKYLQQQAKRSKSKNGPLLPSAPSTSSTSSSSTSSTLSTSTSSSSHSIEWQIYHDLYSQYLVNVSQYLKFRWAKTMINLFDIKYEVEERNWQHTGIPIDFTKKPYLLVQLNQTSLSESLFLPAALNPAVVGENNHNCPFPTFPTAHTQQTTHTAQAQLPPVLFPPHILMNWEFSLLPFWGTNPSLLGAIIDRSSNQEAKMRAKQMIEDVAIRMRDRGESFYMSIEGVRSPHGGLSPYKKGAAVLAIKAQCDIIPVITIGARDILPFGDWRVRSGRTFKVIFDKAISTKGMKYEDRHKLTQMLWDIAVKELTPHDFVTDPIKYKQERAAIAASQHKQHATQVSNHLKENNQSSTLASSTSSNSTSLSSNVTPAPASAFYVPTPSNVTPSVPSSVSLQSLLQPMPSTLAMNQCSQTEKDSPLSVKHSSSASSLSTNTTQANSKRSFFTRSVDRETSSSPESTPSALNPLVIHPISIPTLHNIQSKLNQQTCVATSAFAKLQGAQVTHQLDTLPSSL